MLLMISPYLCVRDYPDTDAGRNFWTEKLDALHDIDRKRPPLKRLGRNGLEVPTWNTDDAVTSSEVIMPEYPEVDIGQHADVEVDAMDIDENDSSPCVGASFESYENATALDLPQMSSHSVGDESSDREELHRASHCRLFNVVREERYVQIFRAESIAQPDNDSTLYCDKDAAMAFRYSLMKPQDRRKSSAEDDDFYDKHDALFYSLMRSMVSKQLPYLPSRTMLPVLLVPSCRGITKDGAVIYSPSQADYLEYVYYHERRSEPSLSSSRQANKRLGEWRGVDMNRSEITSSSSVKTPRNLKHRAHPGMEEEIPCHGNGGEGRVILGCITSGRYAGSPNGAVSYGLCDAMQLQLMTVSAAKVLLEYQRTGNDGARPSPRGKVLSLVMFKSARSRWLRPALIEIISVLQ